MDDLREQSATDAEAAASRAKWRADRNAAILTQAQTIAALLLAQCDHSEDRIAALDIAKLLLRTQI